LQEKILVPQAHPRKDEEEDPYFKTVKNINDKQDFVDHANGEKWARFG
jgi:hypothetical protein